MKAIHTNDVVPLLSSSYYFKLCENLTSEDNFNNTFFDKILPHTTAVATEFRGKGNTISRDSKNKTGLCCIKPILRVYMLIFISRKDRKGKTETETETIHPQRFNERKTDCFSLMSAGK